MTGGGFGGATINLVQHAQAASFIKFISREYESRSGHKLDPMFCQIVDGAH